MSVNKLGVHPFGLNKKDLSMLKEILDNIRPDVHSKEVTEFACEFSEEISAVIGKPSLKDKFADAESRTGNQKMDTLNKDKEMER